MPGSNIVEEIFVIKSDTAEVIKNLQQAKGVYKELTEEQVKQVAELTILEEKEKKLLAARNKSNNPTTYIQINKQIDENTKKLGALKEATDRFTKSESAAKTEANALQASIQNAFKSTQIRAAADEVKILENRTKGLTASGFNPLGNSINQISRELPAFAVSAQIGILAISNNIPALFDAFERIKRENAELAAQGVKTTSTLKQLGSAIFSFGTLLSVAVTLITIYGKEIGNFVSALFQGEKALESITKANDNYNKSINQTKEDIVDLKIQLQVQAKLISKNDGDLLKNENARQKALRTAAELKKKSIEDLKKELGITDEVLASVTKIKEAQATGKGSISVFDLQDAKNVEKYSEELAKINILNRTNIDYINEEYNLRGKVIRQDEDGNKVRVRNINEELIRRRSAADEIRQLLIDAGNDERQREEENVRFAAEKALRQIDINNQIEKDKKRLALANYNADVATAKANVTNEKQLAEELKSLKKKYFQDIRKIEADNISRDEQNQLRIAIETDLQKKLTDIDIKFSKELNERLRRDFEQTIQSRIDILNEDKDFELFLLEDKYAQEEEKGKKASKDELKRLRELILAKKIEILKDKAEQEKNDVVNKARLSGSKENATEILAIENKLENDIERLRLKSAKQERKSLKDRLAEYVDYFAQIVHAAIDATNKLLQIKIKEVDDQINQQQRRISEAKNIADRGNAELLELEQKRLDDLTKKKEKFVRDQQALAAVELVANTAIAVSKAAAQGGVAAGVTIAAALIALVAGLATARSIASQAAFYDGGEYDYSSKGGETGTGDPRKVSMALGKKPYTYHKAERIFDHKKTRQFREVFKDVHEGRVDLNEWKKKVEMFDRYVQLRPMNMHAPVMASAPVTNIIQLKSLEGKMDQINESLRAQKFGLNVDEDGFTQFMQKRIARKNYIKNTLAKP